MCDNGPRIQSRDRNVSHNGSPQIYTLCTRCGEYSSPSAWLPNPLTARHYRYVCPQGSELAAAIAKKFLNDECAVRKCEKGPGKAPFVAICGGTGSSENGFVCWVCFCSVGGEKSRCVVWMHVWGVHSHAGLEPCSRT